MEDELTRFLKHYLRLRAAHPLIALLLLICLSGTAAEAKSCTETCTLNAQSIKHQRSIAMNEPCCGGSERMACCEPAKSDSDKTTASELKLNLRNFAPVLPTASSAPHFMTVALAQIRLSSYEQHATSAARPQRLYIINRSLLI